MNTLVKKPTPLGQQKRKFDDSEVNQISDIMDMMSVKKKIRMSLQDVEELLTACMDNNVHEIKIILKNHIIEPSIVYQNISMRTPLMIAIIYGSNDVAAILIHSKTAEINAIDAHGKTALFYASKLKNFMIVKLLLTYRVENISQMVIEDPKIEKLYYNITSGKYKKKSVKNSSPRIKVDTDQSVFRNNLGIIYENKCIFSGAPMPECDHQFISSPKQHKDQGGYTTDNGILISKYLNRKFYKPGKITFDKESIKDFDENFVMIRVITEEPEIIYLNGKAIKLQRVSIPFIV
jgi:ankyrin repeat protein